MGAVESSALLCNSQRTLSFRKVKAQLFAGQLAAIHSVSSYSAQFVIQSPMFLLEAMLDPLEIGL